MASEKKTNGDSTPEVGSVGAGVTKRKTMLGGYLPEGKTEEDIVLTGLLLPQYLGKQILEKLALSKGKQIKDLTPEEIDTIVPAIGLFDRVEVLPIQERQGDKDFAPFSLLLRDVREPIVGFRGKDEKRVEVLVEKGGDVLVPVSGQTTVNKQVHEMIRDLENVYLVAARPVGQEKVNNQPSAMIRWDIEIVKVGERRSDKGASWALPPWYVVCVATGDLTGSIRNKEHVGLLLVQTEDGIDATPAGNVINRKTGEIIARLGENGRVLPPEKRLAETSTAPS